MRFVFLTLFYFCFSLSAGALEVGSSVADLKLKDQFEEEVKISVNTRWMLFVADKKSSQMLTDYFLQNSLNPENFATIYVSDISGMPSLITKMVALPKMKKYPFKMALDSQGDVTKSWPRQAGQITVFEISGQLVKAVRYLTSPQDVADFVKSSK